MDNRKYFILIAAVILNIFTLKLHAQDDDSKEAARQLVEIADEAYAANLALDLVREQYEQAATLDPENIKANFMTGELYILRGPHKERATKYLLKVLELDPEYRFNILYKIGQGYQFGLQFDQAIEYYNRYKQKLLTTGKTYTGDDKTPVNEVDRRIYECENGKKFVANPENYSIENIGTQINSEAYDFAPVLNEDETMLIFTTRRQEGNSNENVDIDNYYFEDIFMARKTDGQWQKAENIGSVVNTPNHDSNLGLSADGKTLYLYRDENGGDIYYSELQKNGTWSEPQPLPGAINSSYFENAASVSPTRDALFFSSDRPGGYGGLDIYVCTKDGRGEWSRIHNLGPTINTPLDDEGPFIDYDGKTLYFSSRGHDGMGGFDIFISEYDSATEEWTTPVNLGYPVNTPDDDVYFVATKDRKRGYYSSVKDDGMGYTDIYEVIMPDLTEKIKEKQLAKQNPELAGVDKNEEKTNLQAAVHPVVVLLRVQEASNGAALDAEVNMRSVQGNVIVPVERVQQGIYRMQVTNQTATDYMISAEKQGYIFKNSRMTIPAAGDKPMELKRRFDLERFEVGAHDILRNIYFNFDKWTFTKESYNELNKLERMLHENPNYVVKIDGHTDNIGAADYNLNLSHKRAQAVVNYLIDKGIDRRRLKAEGFGESRPIASNDDEKEGREINRRVEFTVLSEGFQSTSVKK